jgi:hypothetical protein
MEKRKKFGIYGDNIAIALIIIGFLMMVQPITMVLYSFGFTVILIGVVLFNITSHY